MTALIIATAKALFMLSAVALLIVATACAVWWLVYYGWRCRKNPIQKTAMLTAAVLWLVSSAIINLA